MGHAICVLFVRIPSLAYAAGDAQSKALLDDVRCLVGRRSEIGRRAERNPVAVGVGSSPQLLGCMLRVAIGVRADTR